MSTKSVARYENLLTTQVENLQVVFYFNTKTFSALNYAQGFGAMVKELQIRSGLQSRKDEYYCPVTNTFMPLSALSTMSPPSVQTVRDLDR